MMEDNAIKGQRPAKLSGKMRKGLVVGLLALAVVFAYYNLRPFDSVPDRPEEFELVFRYGVSAKNVLDTREDTFTKDLILDPSITVQLALTERELDTVWAYVQRNDFYSLEEQNPARSSSEIKLRTLSRTSLEIIVLPSGSPIDSI